MRCVFDTSVVVSALLFRDSIPDRAFYLTLGNGIILVSLETFEELVEVINRRKFDRYLTLEEREEFLESFLEESEFIKVMDDAKVCRDPKDDKFLNLASSGRADYIVTGDDDLLVLGTYRNAQILKAGGFLELFT
ncbi:putative toxin-antitoxin system toxin component, PIN family [Nodosilinea sp. AN01ver1]|uniref:putative toxin-antitoxin system toxin component, PIN family n=1 Tax=Nodosilinea sp. AN01ver1 TaxID=3423362 RepID=UPI003D321DEF